MRHNEIIQANKVIYQEEIFPELNLKLGVVTSFHEQLLLVLDLMDVDSLYPRAKWDCGIGRPPVNRQQLFRAFVAKVLLNLSTTVDLIERLKVDRVLRGVCGFDYRSDLLPSESAFSRGFAEFARANLCAAVHLDLICRHCSAELYEHTAIDASAIAVAERDHKRIVETKITAEQQRKQSLAEVLAELPSTCDYGAKRDSNGNKMQWKGYKLSIAVNEYNIPLAGVVSSASTHDSLMAIPLVRMVEERVDTLYYTADKGYDSTAIREEISSYGKIGIIDFNRRNNKKDNRRFDPCKQERYKTRTFSESAFAQIKRGYLPRYILLRGYEKVKGLLDLVMGVITAIQIIKYA